MAIVILRMWREERKKGRRETVVELCQDDREETKLTAPRNFVIQPAPSVPIRLRTFFGPQCPYCHVTVTFAPLILSWRMLSGSVKIP